MGLVAFVVAVRVTAVLLQTLFAGPVTEAVGPALTVNTTESMAMHPSLVVTVKRKVAEELLTCTAVVKEEGLVMVADPEATLQVAVFTVSPPIAVAAPAMVKEVETPCAHCACAGPATASPNCR